MQTTEVKRITIKVVACIFLRKRKILITSRPNSKNYSSFWEFPGGKVEKFENDFQALKREIYEELSVYICKKDIVIFDSYKYEYPEHKVNLKFYICRNWKGIIVPRENQNLKWVCLQELTVQKLLPSNKKVVEKLLNRST
tara:strand:+ start:589 stop:1008 length:420 start_codon:yes stop_codon:yes gene_type:complete